MEVLIIEVMEPIAINWPSVERFMSRYRGWRVVKANRDPEDWRVIVLVIHAW